MAFILNLGLPRAIGFGTLEVQVPTSDWRGLGWRGAQDGLLQLLGVGTCDERGGGPISLGSGEAVAFVVSIIHVL